MNSLHSAAPVQSIASESRLQTVFQKQYEASRQAPYPDLDERLSRLETLRRVLTEHQSAIAEAIHKDYGNRSTQETRMLEIYGLISGLNYTIKRVKKWMKPSKRHVGLSFFGAKNTVIPQPKGVIGVVSPWNYPLFLALSPCTSALAAGNRCIVKMAANSQNLARLMDKLLSQVFEEEVLTVIPGVAASEFTAMPWDHLVFTGSPATAKTVMATAAQTLTPVTLELGGKSPTIIAEDYDVDKAAERLLFAKFLNAGQTCVAPDYLFVPRAKVEAFTAAARRVLQARYETAASGDFTSVIDQKAFARLKGTLDDAVSKGAKAVKLLKGEAFMETGRKIAPHLVTGVQDDMLIMQDEIFGPLLPVMPYDSLDEVIAFINARERPLALYLYSNDKRLQDKVIFNTLSGGVCLNDSMLHVAQHDMPFGGIGNSGMGHYHGYEGFVEFSKMRPVFKQTPGFSSILLMAPPYGRLFEWMYKMMIRFKL